MDSDNMPSTSLLIYLFADMFIPPAQGLFPQAALAPRTGDKVDLRKLVLRVYAAAMMDLHNSGMAYIQPAQVKKLLGKETAPVLELRPGAPLLPARSLPAQLADRVTGRDKPEERRVREVVIRMVGGRSSTRQPWFVALKPVIADAVAEGYVARPEERAGILKTLFNPAETRTRVTADLSKIDPLRSGAISANGRLDQFLAYQGETGEMLLREIENGIKACMDTSDD